MKSRVPNLREPEKGLKDWVATLFAFEFESITHSIGRFKVASGTSGRLRYRLPQPPWVHKMSAPAFCTEAAVVPFVSERVVRCGHEWKRERSPTRTGRSPTSERGVSTDSAAHHRWGQHPLCALLHHRRAFEIQRWTLCAGRSGVCVVWHSVRFEPLRRLQLQGFHPRPGKSQEH